VVAGPGSLGTGTGAYSVRPSAISNKAIGVAVLTQTAVQLLA